MGRALRRHLPTVRSECVGFTSLSACGRFPGTCMFLTKGWMLGWRPYVSSSLCGVTGAEEAQSEEAPPAPSLAAAGDVFVYEGPLAVTVRRLKASRMHRIPLVLIFTPISGLSCTPAL